MKLDPVRIIAELGVDRPRVGAIELLSERHGHGVWRVAVGGAQRVLKWLPADAATREIGGLELLRRCGVPTPPVHMP